MKAIADALTAMLNAFQRLILWLAMGLVMIVPGWFPLLDRFVLDTTEINVLGQKVKVIDSRRSQEPNLPGLTIEGGSVKLHGQDLNLIVGERDRFLSEAESLRQENAELGRKLSEATSRLADAAAARPTMRGMAEPRPEAVDPPPVAAPAPAPAPALASAGAPFAAMLSSDSSLGAGGAKDEIAKAQAWASANPPAAPVRVFLRNGLFVTALAFATRESAQQALPSLRRVFPATNPYVADLRTWCPAGLSGEPQIRDGIAVTDCRF